MKHILIFGHSNIGDVCYDLLVVGPLRRAFPQARISFVTSLRAQEAASLACGVDEVIIFDKQGAHKGLRGYVRLIRYLRGQFQYLLNISRVIAPRLREPAQKNDHVAVGRLRLLQRAGIDNQPYGLELCFRAAEQARAQELIASSGSGPRVGIMPFAGWRLKCWPGEYWRAIISWLLKHYQARVFVFGKTTGQPWEESIARQIPAAAVSLINRCTLRESICVLRHMDVFTGVDSSLVHFSGGLRIPTVSLFGPTSARLYQPLFSENFTVQTPYRAACVPCFRRRRPGGCDARDGWAECMRGVTVDAVKEKLRLALEVEGVARVHGP